MSRRELEDPYAPSYSSSSMGGGAGGGGAAGYYPNSSSSYYSGVGEGREEVETIGGGGGGSSDSDVTRIYIGNLPSSVTQSEVEDLFQRYGVITRCDFKRTVSGAPFAFIEFEDPRDARDAIEGRDGYTFDGCRLRVEIPFESRAGGGRRGGRGGRGGGGRRGRFKVRIDGLPETGSWQDLKDHMRDVGECGHAQVYRNGTGQVDFYRKEDMEEAIRKYNGSAFRSHEGERTTINVSGYIDREGINYDEDFISGGGGGGGGGFPPLRRDPHNREPPLIGGAGGRDGGGAGAPFYDRFYDGYADPYRRRERSRRSESIERRYFSDYRDRRMMMRSRSRSRDGRR